MSPPTTDDSQSAPSSSTPPSPPMDGAFGGGSNNTFRTLPPGWTMETDPHDGRLFYWYAATGQASWTHPQYHHHHEQQQKQQQQENSRNNDTGDDNQNNISATRPRDRPQPPPRPPTFDYVPAPSDRKNRGYYSTPAATTLPPPGHEEDPYVASRRPDNHQCGAIASLILCPPLGLFALYHSIRVDQCWKGGQYSDAVIHSRQSPQFSSWGILLGAVFWICWFFFRRGRGEWEWPEWNIFGD